MRLDSKTEFYNISYFFDLHDSFFSLLFYLYIYSDDRLFLLYSESDEKGIVFKKK